MPSIDTHDLRDLHVAVTGASGFIGRHLVTALQARRARVTLLLRPGGGPPPAATALGSVPINFDDVHAIGNALKSVGATHVMHLAGYANSDRSVDAISKSLDVNLVAAMRVVLGAMDTMPDARVVVTGSLEAADPWRERLALGSPYGISKAMLEVLTGGLQRLYGSDVVNLRIGMTYGPDDPNRHRLVPSVITALLDGRSPKMASGDRRCDWIYVDDVIEAMIHAALLPRGTIASMDVGSGRLISIHDVAEMIHDEIGVPIPIEYLPALNRPHEQERCADAAGVEKVTGWHVRTGLAEGIRQTVRWYRNQHRH